MGLRTTALPIIALLVVGASVALAAPPGVSAPHSGFLVGDPGDLRPAVPEEADFTMAADGITIITIAWLDCFNVYEPAEKPVNRGVPDGSASGGSAVCGRWPASFTSAGPAVASREAGTTALRLTSPPPGCAFGPGCRHRARRGSSSRPSLRLGTWSCVVQRRS